MRLLVIPACMLWIVSSTGAQGDAPVYYPPVDRTAISEWWDSFEVVELQQAEPPSVLGDSVSIPVGPDTVPIRVDTIPFSLKVRLASEHRQEEQSSTLWAYEATDLRQQGQLVWRFAAPWPQDERTRVLLDEHTGLAYLVKIRSGLMLIVPIMPVPEPVSVEQAVENWFTQSLPEGALVLRYTSALARAGESRFYWSPSPDGPGASIPPESWEPVRAHRSNLHRPR